MPAFALTRLGRDRRRLVGAALPAAALLATPLRALARPDTIARVKNSVVAVGTVQRLRSWWPPTRT